MPQAGSLTPLLGEKGIDHIMLHDVEETDVVKAPIKQVNEYESMQE